MSAEEMLQYVMRTCMQIKHSSDIMVELRDLIEDTSMPPAGAAVVVKHVGDQIVFIYDKIDKMHSDVASWFVTYGSVDDLISRSAAAAMAEKEST